MVELKVIAKVLEIRSLQRAVEKRVRAELFREYSDVWVFITHHFHEYGEIPAVTTVIERFPTIQLPHELPEPIDYYIDELREKRRYTLLTRAIQSAAQLVTDDTVAAMDSLQEAMRLIHLEVGETTDHEWTENVDARFTEYEENERLLGISGLHTPWQRLDELTMGWQNSHLITIAGRPKRGKSWALSLAALQCVRDNHRVLFVTLEMSPEEIMRRADALYSRLPYSDFRKARLGEEVKQRYRESLNEIASLQGKFYITGDSDAKGRVGVTFLEAKIRQYQPAIVMIDGVYLMHDERNGHSKTEKLYNLTQDLKRLARHFQIPVIVTTQMGRGNENQAGGQSGIQWSDSFAQDSDEMIELFQTNEMRERNEMDIVLMTQREGETGVFRVSWNLQTMDFGVDGLIDEDDLRPQDDVGFGGIE